MIGSTILCGDALAKLRDLPDESVQCCVTSPPYWGLRDYGTAKWEGGEGDCDHIKSHSMETSGLEGGKTTTLHNHYFADNCGKCGAEWIDAQLGLEKTPEEYVAKMVAVFREVRRVLRKDGTLWLNLGDSYASGKGTCYNPGGNTSSFNVHLKAANVHPLDRGNKSTLAAQGLKPKDLIGIPWRVAFALQADGWWLRSDIIWNKPNPMPESVSDRPTKSHEYIFLLTKSARYFYDAVAVAEPLACGSIERLSQPSLDSQRGSERVPGKANGAMKAVSRKPYTNGSTKDYKSSGAQDASATKSRIVDSILSGQLISRNKRSVWTVTTQPYAEAHFATFPPNLIKPCILAGSKAAGTAASTEEATVLDPFAGSGTTGQVALELGRRAILIELNPKYAALIEQRTNITPGLALTTNEVAA